MDFQGGPGIRPEIDTKRLTNGRNYDPPPTIQKWWVTTYDFFLNKYTNLENMEVKDKTP